MATTDTAALYALNSSYGASGPNDEAPSTQKHRLRLLVLGPRKAGKSSLANFVGQLSGTLYPEVVADSQLDTYRPTQGLRYVCGAREALWRTGTDRDVCGRRLDPPLCAHHDTMPMPKVSHAVATPNLC